LKRLTGWLGSRLADLRRSEPRTSLKVGLVADELTRSCLRHECRVVDLSPSDFVRRLEQDRPDLVFVESAWHGHREAWKYRVAAYPDHPERDNADLARLVSHARALGIPSVFWNKEDGVHFERFIASARLFDHVFTVDENCIPRYRAELGPDKTVQPLLFAVQPTMHHPSGVAPRHMRANFVGSYSRHIHTSRRELQDMLFEAATAELGLTVFDRNSGRRSANYRYPEHLALEVRPAVPHEATAAIYGDYLVSLNVNTVQDSATMFSRRLVEIMACGGLAATTPALSVERLFLPFCHVVHSDAQAHELFARLKRNGLSAQDREMAAAAADHVLRHHTWSHRVRQILDTLDL